MVSHYSSSYILHIFSTVQNYILDLLKKIKLKDLFVNVKKKKKTF